MATADGRLLHTFSRNRVRKQVSDYVDYDSVHKLNESDVTDGEEFIPVCYTIEKGAKEDDILTIKPYKWFEGVLACVSFITFILDLGFDIKLCHIYFMTHEWLYFGFSISFVCIPSLIMTAFSLSWYIHDYKQEMKDHQKSSVSKIRWFVRIIFLVLQIGPVLRYIESVIYGYKSLKAKRPEKKKYYFQLMLYEEADSTMLRLFECFLESGPQLILQLYIMSTQGADTEFIRVALQGVSCISSLLSLAWSLTAYHKALRFTRMDKNNLNITGMIIHFIWGILTILPRVLAISLFASVFHYWIFVIIGCHYAIITLWLIHLRTNFCDTRMEEIAFNFICGVIYIFCYFNLKEGKTRNNYIFYYTLLYIENAAMIAAWYIFMKDPGSWYHLTSLVIVLAGFILGIVFQVAYYTYFHPNKVHERKMQKILHRKEGDRRPAPVLNESVSEIVFDAPAVTSTPLRSKSSKESTAQNSENSLAHNDPKPVFNSFKSRISPSNENASKSKSENILNTHFKDSSSEDRSNSSLLIGHQRSSDGVSVGNDTSITHIEDSQITSAADVTNSPAKRETLV